MTAPAARAALITTLANWLNRDDLNTTEIPEGIALAEDHFNQTVFTPDRETQTSITVDAEEESLPTDLWKINAVYLDTDPKVTLEQMTLAEFRNSHSAAATGQPVNYALRGDKIIFGPSPQQSYTAKMAYTQTIPALTTANTTNWLLTRHPSLYVQGALFELHTLLRDTEGAAIAKARRDEQIELINRSGRRRSWGQAPQRIRAPYVV